jgi:hypothetical protein
MDDDRVVDVVRGGPDARGMELLRRRRAFSTALALVLAVESVASVSVAASSYVSAASRAAASQLATAAAAEVISEARFDERSWTPTPAPAVVSAPDAADYMHPKPLAPVVATPTRAPVTKAAAPTAKAAPKAPARTTVRTTVKTTAQPARHPAPKPVSTVFAGRNHLWIPSLGVNRSVSAFSCSRSEPPGNLVYRWGCAGTNNVYLFGHAASVFGPLYNAYMSHRLAVGMNVWYADGSGHVHKYAVRYWRVVSPVGADWAFAPQSVPSMTLQTCVGANSQYRLIVRLVQVG